MANPPSPKQPGIWVRISLDTRATLTGFAPGADSPNDFWTLFKTQLVRLHDVIELRPDGVKRRYDMLYVNRDRIVLVDVAEGNDRDHFHEQPVDA